MTDKKGNYVAQSANYTLFSGIICEGQQLRYFLLNWITPILYFALIFNAGAAVAFPAG